MLLPEFLLDALPEDSASGITFKCSGKDTQKEVETFFTQVLDEEWEKQKEAFEEEIGIEPDESDDIVLSGPQFLDDSVVFTLATLDMQANDGAAGYTDFGCEAVEEALRRFAEKYPDIPYHCWIQFFWCDEHTSETVTYELPNSSDEMPQFAVDAVVDSLRSGQLEEDLNDFVEFDEDMIREFRDFAKTAAPMMSEEDQEALKELINGLAGDEDDDDFDEDEDEEDED